jgi:uncharacterized protein YjbJ (UPF0337 family)
MNKENLEGKFDQIAGAVKQKTGEALHDQGLANSGVADQVKGAAKETYGNAKDVAEENRANRADNARDHIVNAAQNVKDNINAKLDEKRDDRRNS